MPQIITSQQLGQYQTMLDNGQVSQFYDAMSAQGYNYAGWANGVARENSITGLSALDYLKGTALMGMGGEACRILSTPQIEQIKQDMAKGYLDTLKGIARDSGGILSR
jgi:hypothetical protein